MSEGAPAPGAEGGDPGQVGSGEGGSGGGEGGIVPAPDWRSSFDADVRDNPVTQRLESPEAAVRELIGVQKLIGGEKIPRPSENWTEKEWSRFYGELGRPEEPGNYDLGDFQVPEGLPWSEEFQGRMLGKLHEAGLNHEQVRKVLSSYVEDVYGQFREQSDAVAATAESAAKELQSEWGSAYGANMEVALRALTHAAGENKNEIAEMELKDGSKLGDNPMFIRMLSKLGNSMSEHGLIGETKGEPRLTRTPAEAEHEIAKLNADEKFLASYNDKNHPEHQYAVDRMLDLIRQAKG